MVLLIRACGNKLFFGDEGSKERTYINLYTCIVSNLVSQVDSTTYQVGHKIDLYHFYYTFVFTTPKIKKNHIKRTIKHTHIPIIHIYIFFLVEKSTYTSYSNAYLVYVVLQVTVRENYKKTLKHKWKLEAQMETRIAKINAIWITAKAYSICLQNAKFKILYFIPLTACELQITSSNKHKRR